MTPLTARRSANLGRMPVALNSPSTFSLSPTPVRSKTKMSCMVMTSPSMPTISETWRIFLLPSPSRLTWITRFVADVLNGTPSIVVGVFAWAWIVATQKHFSALAGSAALAMLMIPMVLRTTEEMIKLVPTSLREAALALGYPRWRASLSIVVRTTLPGIVTGGLLAVARISGETAPLLFTALGSQYMSLNLDQPMAALPLTVFTYATGPFEEWRRYAWAAALVLILVVFVLSVGARLAIRRRFSLNG